MATAAVTAIVTGLTAVVAGTVTTAAGFFAVVAIVAGGQLLIEKLNERDVEDAEAPTNTIVAGVQNARWVFGRARIGGSLVWIHHNDRDLHMIMALSEGELDGIDSIYIGGELATFTQTGNTFFGSGKWQGRIEITQNFDPNASDRGQRARNAGIGWTGDHRLDGISYLYIKLNQNNYGDRADRRFWTSIPSFEFVVRGMRTRTRFDSRDRFTANAADFWYWWMTERRGIPADEIDRTAFLAARTTCANIFYPDGGQRYEINGVITSGDNASAIQTELEFAIAGGSVEYDGLQILRPGADRPTIQQITEDDIISEPVIQIAPPQPERVNRVSATLLQDKDYEYQSRETPAIQDNAAVSRDGETLPTDLGTMRLINSQQAVQYLAAVALRQARHAQQLQLEVRPGDNLERLSLVPGDVVGVTIGEFGISQQNYTINRIETLPGQAVKLTMLERPDDLYDSPTFQQTPIPAIPSIDEEVVAAPTGLTASARISRDSVSIDVSWDASPYTTFIQAQRDDGVTIGVGTSVLPPTTSVTIPGATLGNWTITAFAQSSQFGVASDSVSVDLNIRRTNLPSPAPPTNVVGEPLGRAFRIRFDTEDRPDAPPTGIDVRYNRRDFGSSDTLDEITTGNWDDAERLVVAALAPQTEDRQAIADTLIEFNGHYRIFLRTLSSLGAQSDIAEVGSYDLRRAENDTFQSEASPLFLGDKGEASVYRRGARVLLIPTRDGLDEMSDGDFNGENGWPFGITTDSTYQSEFVDVSMSREVVVTAAAEFFTATGNSPDAPTIEVVYKTAENASEQTETLTLDEETTITGRFIAVKATFNTQAMRTLSITGRYSV